MTLSTYITPNGNVMRSFFASIYYRWTETDPERDKVGVIEAQDWYVM